MIPITNLSDTLPMPEGQRASLPLLDLKNDTKLVLVALPSGVQIPAHAAPYPASVLLLSGAIEVMLGETWKQVGPGELVPNAEELLHSARASEPSYFLVSHLRGLGSKSKASN